jgi:2,4-dienoyl-CoA reductase-like NADH-dependent reductase (Old Yellow Enzyme family)/thioredoxin reductase
MLKSTFSSSIMRFNAANQTMKIEKLFEPKKINSVEIKNRFVVPPMVTNFGNLDNTVSDKLIGYLSARARGGFGLIITEDFAVHPLGKGFSRVPALWSDDFIKGCKSLVDAVHGAGSKIFAQIYHAGAQTGPDVIGEQPLAPSALLHVWYGTLPRELKKDEIYEIIDNFGQAALRARNAGFDGVEVHGSHGYLVAQFLSPFTNKRTDEFGGNLLGRLRFPVRMIESIRVEVGRDFPVTLRIAGDERVLGGRELEETRVMAPILEEAGYDALHVTTATTANMPYIVPCNYAPIALNVGYAETVKRNVTVPVITTGRIYDPFVAEQILREERADFIGMGRASIADPDLPNKVAAGDFEGIRPCIGALAGCVAYLHMDRGITCLANPGVGLEEEMKIRKVSEKKRVLVVGGGPAGLEASRVAALAGHTVVLYERNDRLGGQLNIASVPPQKHEIARLVKYMVTQVKRANVDVHLGREISADMVNGFDAVIVATGGRPNIPKIPGIQSSHVMDAWELLRGIKTTGERVAVIGGGLMGCETAHFLASQRKKVTIIEMFDKIAWDAFDRITFFLLPILEEQKIEVRTSAKVIAILPDGVEVQVKESSEKWGGYDSIVIAMGTRSMDELLEKIKQRMPKVQVMVIGDAKEPRTALEAISEGAQAGRSL